MALPLLPLLLLGGAAVLLTSKSKTSSSSKSSSSSSSTIDYAMNVPGLRCQVIDIRGGFPGFDFANIPGLDGLIQLSLDRHPLPHQPDWEAFLVTKQPDVRFTFGVVKNPDDPMLAEMCKPLDKVPEVRFIFVTGGLPDADRRACELLAAWIQGRSDQQYYDRICQYIQSDARSVFVSDIIRFDSQPPKAVIKNATVVTADGQSLNAL